MYTKIKFQEMEALSITSFYNSIVVGESGQLHKWGFLQMVAFCKNQPFSTTMHIIKKLILV